MKSNVLDGARSSADVAHEQMPILIESVRFRNTPESLNYCYTWLASGHKRLAVHDYLVEGNLQSFKQHLHVASKLEIAAISLKDCRLFTTVGSEIFYALLSDSPTVIDTSAKLAPPYFVEDCGNPLNAEFIVHMYQLAIQGDYEALQAKVERLAKNGRKKDRELPAQGRDFFSLLMRGDKQGLEDLIAQHAKVKSQDVLTEDFMCFEGTIEAKICWLKGIQVQIDSPMLPMDLMPIKSLAHYNDVYDFLAPNYVPPKVSLLERLRYWYLERARGKAITKAALEAQDKGHK